MSKAGVAAALLVLSLFATGCGGGSPSEGGAEPTESGKASAAEDAAFEAYLDCSETSETAAECEEEWKAWKSQPGQAAPPCATCGEVDAAMAAERKAWEDETYADCYAALGNGWTAGDTLRGFYFEYEHLRNSEEFDYRSSGCQKAIADWYGG